MKIFSQHDITEILLKLALSTNQSIQYRYSESFETSIITTLLDNQMVVKFYANKPSSVPEFTLAISGVRVAPSLVFCVMFCKSLFVLLTIILSVLRLTTSDYPFWYLQTFFQVNSVTLRLNIKFYTI